MLQEDQVVLDHQIDLLLIEVVAEQINLINSKIVQGGAIEAESQFVLAPKIEAEGKIGLDFLLGELAAQIVLIIVPVSPQGSGNQLLQVN